MMYNKKSGQKIIFGTDGWRGLIYTEINDETISVVARAFVDYLNSKELNNIKVAVAYDGRRNSKSFAEKFSQVLSANKIHVYFSDKIIPTPVLSFFVKKKSLNAGVMITASHNPPQYNGVKFKAHYGGPFLTEETKLVEEFLYLRSYSYDQSNIEIVDMFEPYFHHISRLIDFDKIREAQLFPLIDSMNGAGQNFIQKILNENGISAETIFSTPDENFNGRQPEPIAKNLIPLSEQLKSTTKYSVGLATDGDADRCGVMLENGEWLSTQETILYLIDYIVNERKFDGHIVKTSSVTDKVYRFQTDERKVFDVQVGFKYICEKMINEDIAIGCEESGGFGFKFHIPERDGILSSLFILEMLANSGLRKMSEFVAIKRREFGKIFYDRIDLDFERPDRLKKLPAIFKNPPERIGNFEVKKIESFKSSHDEINGLKFYLSGENHWLLIRASETEPIIRFYAEANSDEEVKEILNSGIDLIEKTQT
ncbi:MAG: phosphoglucomutase [Ignavibacteria bacterium]|nr:phosphoglucomutase [Ignavibacteria bacterium]MDH7527970.1 phosphoglucomutase [Ignavibacteria bacterium]